MRWRGPAKLALSLSAVTLLSSCTYLGDWSSQHHMRLYERYRLVAHHDLSDGRPEDAISNVKRALAELRKAKPKDQMALESSLLELGGMYLAENQPKEALECYNQVGVNSVTPRESKDLSEQNGQANTATLAAQAAAGKAFCFLKLNEMDKASHEFRRALLLYKDKSAALKTIVFPIDLCPSCCQWGLEQSSRILRNPHDSIEFKMIENQPLPCECVTTRSILARTNPPGIPIQSTVSGSDKILPSAIGTTNGAEQKRKDAANLQNSWNTLIQAGKRSLRSNEYEKAERYFKSAISLLRKNNDKGARLLESLQCLSFFYITHERRADAMPYLKEEIELQSERFGKNDVALIAPLCRYAGACMREGQLDIADKVLTQALEISDRFQKNKNETSAIVHANLCELRLLQRRFNDTEIHGQKAIAIFQSVGSRNYARIAGTNFTLARAYLADNKLVEAQVQMKASLSLLEMKDVSPYVKLHVLLTRAELALKLKDLETAKQAVQDARVMLNTIKASPASRSRKMAMETQLEKLETMIGGAVK